MKGNTNSNITKQFVNDKFGAWATILSGTNYNVEAKDIGGTKFIHIHFNALNANIIGQTLFTMPIGYRPNDYVRLMVGGDYSDDTSGRIAVGIDVNPNGNVFFYPRVSQMSGTMALGVKIYGDAYFIL